MIKNRYTDEQRIRRVWDVIEIKNLMARQMYFESYGLFADALDQLWVRLPDNQKTASYGSNTGYLSGMQAIRAAFRDRAQAAGTMRMHQLASPFIEISADGETAQGLWYSPGQVTESDGECVDALWSYGRYGADFVKEDGVWRIWHLFFGVDLEFPAGSRAVDTPLPTRFSPNEEVAYTSRYNHTLYPPIPAPYTHFCDPEIVSNGPEGNPAWKEGKA